MLMRARNLQNASQNVRRIHLFTSNEDVQYESFPTVMITSETDKLGHIVSLNQSVSNVTGYQKAELLNRNVKQIMPDIHAKYHNLFLENYLATQEAKFMNKERMVFIKNKSGYIFPSYVNISPMSSLNQSQPNLV